MLTYLLAISKYIILVLMLFYTLESLLSFFKKKNKDGIYVRQEIYIFLMQFVAYGTLCLKLGQLEYLFFYAFLQIVLIFYIVLSQMLYPNIQRELSNHMAMLMSIGFLILCRLNFSKSICSRISRCRSIPGAISVSTRPFSPSSNTARSVI